MNVVDHNVMSLAMPAVISHAIRRVTSPVACLAVVVRSQFVALVRVDHVRVLVAAICRPL
jgi:hypothetical protein